MILLLQRRDAQSQAARRHLEMERVRLRELMREKLGDDDAAGARSEQNKRRLQEIEGEMLRMQQLQHSSMTVRLVTSQYYRYMYHEISAVPLDMAIHVITELSMYRHVGGAHVSQMQNTTQ